MSRTLAACILCFAAGVASGWAFHSPTAPPSDHEGPTVLSEPGQRIERPVLVPTVASQPEGIAHSPCACSADQDAGAAWRGPWDASEVEDWLDDVAETCVGHDQFEWVVDCSEFPCVIQAMTSDIEQTSIHAEESLCVDAPDTPPLYSLGSIVTLEGAAHGFAVLAEDDAEVAAEARERLRRDRFAPPQKVSP